MEGPDSVRPLLGLLGLRDRGAPQRPRRPPSPVLVLPRRRRRGGGWWRGHHAADVALTLPAEGGLDVRSPPSLCLPERRGSALLAGLSSQRGLGFCRAKAFSCGSPVNTQLRWPYTHNIGIEGKQVDPSPASSLQSSQSSMESSNICLASAILVADLVRQVSVTLCSMGV